MKELLFLTAKPENTDLPQPRPVTARILSVDEIAADTRIYRLDTGAELRRVIAPPEGTLGVAVSPDSQSLLSGGKDGSVRLWRLSDRDAR